MVTFKTSLLLTQTVLFRTALYIHLLQLYDQKKIGFENQMVISVIFFPSKNVKHLLVYHIPLSFMTVNDPRVLTFHGTKDAI